MLARSSSPASSTEPFPSATSREPTPSSPSAQRKPTSSSSPSPPRLTPAPRPSSTCRQWRGVQIIDMTPSPRAQGALAHHKAPARGSWRCPPLVPTLTALLLFGLMFGGVIYHQRGVSKEQGEGELLPKVHEDAAFVTLEVYKQRYEDDLNENIYEDTNDRYQQQPPLLSEDEAGQKKNMTNMERLRLASCRTTVRGVHYSGKLRRVLHGENIKCLPWSLFDVALYIKQTHWGDVKQWAEETPGMSLEYRPTRKRRLILEQKWRKIFSKISEGSNYCRNYGGLFAEPSCLINGTDALKLDRNTLMSVAQGSFNKHKTVVVACGVPMCPDFFGPHAGQQCRVTQHGTEAAPEVCLPFRDFTPPGALQCNVTDVIHGLTYTWTHPSEGYSLVIPTRARRCHSLRRAVLVKGGYQSRLWFEIPMAKDYVSLRVHPYSDQQQVELILQYRYSADRADDGYNVGLTSRHLHVFHAQNLVHVSRGHVPLLTDFSPLFVWKKVLNVTHDKTVQYAAEDVLEVMNAGKETEVVFKKQGKKAQLSFPEGRRTIMLSSPDEINRFPQFVRLFSDGLVEVEMDSICPIVHVQKVQDFGSDLRETFTRYKDHMTVWARILLEKYRNPVRYFKYLNEGVFFSLQRKKHSTHMVIFHWYSGGSDGAMVFFSTFPQLNDSLLLTLQPPYKFQLVKGVPQQPTEWQNRVAGPFEGRKVAIGWHGYSARFTKTTFTLHHLSKRGTATLIYTTHFLQYQPPILYAFLFAAGGKFTVNCRPRYEEFMKSNVSTQDRLTLVGTEYVGVQAASRSGRACFPSQHSPEGVCRTWEARKALYHGPLCRVLSKKDLDLKMKQLGINGTQEEVRVKKEMNQPASPFFRFGFESCGIRHKYENDPAFHYFSVAHPSEVRRASEAIDLRTVRIGKLEFGFLSGSDAADSVMSLLFLDKSGEKRMQIFLGAFQKYFTVRAFVKGKRDMVRSSKLHRLSIITETNYSHCEMVMTSSRIDIKCWNFEKKQMESVIPNINYQVIINDKSEGAVQYVSFGTHVTVHEALVKQSAGRRTNWFDSTEQRPNQSVSMWRVRLPCPWFSLPPWTHSHLRPLRLDQYYFFQLDQNSSSVSLNFHNTISPDEKYERPLQITYTPGKVVNVTFVDYYKTEVLEYTSNPLEYKFIFSVGKFDLNLWLTVARQLCPNQFRTIMIHRAAVTRAGRPAADITFVKRPGPVLWHEGGKEHTEMELERHNLKLEWFPQHCYGTIPLNTYVVVLRNRFKTVQYIMEVDDTGGLDAATLEFFSVQTHDTAASFSVNTKHCTPLSRKRIEKHKESRLVLSSRGNCSQPCGTGYRLLQYMCERPMNGPLCPADHQGLKTGERVETLKVWATCYEKECYQIENFIPTIRITNLTLEFGEQVTLSCIEAEYKYQLKENMLPDGHLEVHWVKDDVPHHTQSNTIVVTMTSLQDAGLYCCYMRYKERTHYPVKTVGITLAKNERHTMLLRKYEFEMCAPKLLEVLKHQVVASWFHRRTSDEQYKRIKSGFMGWVETLTLKELTDDQLGEYLGCLKGFPDGITFESYETPHVDMACPFYVSLVRRSLKKKLIDFIELLATWINNIDKKHVLWTVLAVVMMRVIEYLTKWLYILRKKKEVDFWYRTRMKMKYGKDRAYSYKGRSDRGVYLFAEERDGR